MFVSPGLQKNLAEGEDVESLLLEVAPCTLHPAPCTLHPAPCTLNPQPSTLNPEPRTLNPQPRTREQLFARDFPAPTGRSYTHGHIVVLQDEACKTWAVPSVPPPASGG